MARKTYYVGGGEPPKDDAQAAAFAQRLNRLLLARGWRQMDLVRKIQGTMPDGEVFQRGPVNSWLRGKHLPSQLNLERVATALGVPMSELMPAGTTLVQAGDKPVQMSMSPNGMARVRLDMELPSELALQVMALVNTAHKGEPR